MSAKVINIAQEWRKFGLSGLQSELDEVAAQIATRQDQSEDSRKALVELTRDFRKNTPEDVRKMIAPLLKSFQSEVDSLSNRSKGAESAFLNVYKKLIDMPDVTPALEFNQSVQQKLAKLADLQIENGQLRDTINDYTAELKDVKSQEVTIKQLEEKIRQHETDQESIIEARTKELERDLLREFQEREQTYHDEQLLSTRRLAEAEHKVAQLTSDLELSQSELFEVKAKYEEKTHARSDELDMVLVDLERANQRAALAEREVDSLKEQLAATVKRAQLADEADVGSDSQRRSATERQLASKDNEICQLVEDVQRLQSQLSELENQSVCQRAKLEEELSQKSSIIQRLEAIIEQQKDYEELKKEFSILKSIEFPGTSQPSAGGADDRSQSEARPLQVLMLEKSKAMQNENTALKVKTAELQGEESWRAPSDAEEAASPDGKSSPVAPEPLPSPRPSPSPAEHAASVAAAAAAAYRFDETDRADRLIPKGDPMETRLQEMLRYNMDKFSNQSLDTLQLARRVRELLSVNNIGQRMFARYILGLSQGTVSELLSKPKPWEKLTEKGRDSYRKMHAWAIDDAAVYLLKAVIPKKAKDSRSSLVGRPEETVADERIAHILTEASQAMKTEPPGSEERPSTDSASPPAQSPLPDSRDALQRMRRLGGPGPGPVPGPGPGPGGPGTEEGTQEKIARLYQEHLAKMMGQRPDMPPGFGLDHYQRLRNPEELRSAMDFYNQELVRHMQHLQQAQQVQQQQAQPLPAVSSAGPAAAAAAGQPERPTGHSGPPESPAEPAEEKGGSAGPFSQARPPSAEPHKAPAVSSPGSLPPTSGGGGGGGGGPLSGLHPAGFFMQSAAAAAAAASSAPDELAPAASPLQRMASITNSLMNSAALPPLQPHPPRPMKAVLPPITQQQFDQFSNLNTEEVVRRIKEHLSQYSISQRLFGESVLGLSQGSVSDLLARPKPWHMLTQKGREPFIRMKMFLDDENAVHKLVASQYKIAPEKLMRTGCYNGGFPKMPLKLPELPKSLESPLPPAVSLSAAGGFPGLAARLPAMDPLMKFGLRLPTAGQLPMSVYETAAITPELDTQYITTKIKEVLLANNIGQKLFGETVLGLSQGSVSELLSKPKPWHLLSIKGREPFIRMKMWLEDTPRNLDKLQRIKTDRKESSKRRRSQMETASESNDSSDVYSTMSNSPNAKKSRVLFSDEQKEALKLAFAMDPYPNMTSVEFLCQELNLTHRTITNWFHNHRMRLKQQTGATGEPAPYLAAAAAGRDSQQLDPLQFRLLLNRRLQDLQREKAVAAGGALPGPMPFPGLPGPLPFPFLDGRLSGEPMSGLDLSMKSDNDFDNQSDDASNLSAGSSPPPAGSPEGEEEDEDGADGGERRQAAPAGRSSRRKPAAPQWVNPQWASEPRRPPAPPQQLINGVCVMQTELEGGETTGEPPSQPLVRVEPESAPEPEPEREPPPEPEQQERPADAAPEPGAEPEQRTEPTDAGTADSSGAE